MYFCYYWLGPADSWWSFLIIHTQWQSADRLPSAWYFESVRLLTAHGERMRKASPNLFGRFAVNLLRPLHTTPPPSKPHVWLLEMKLQTSWKAKGNFLPLCLPCSRTAVLRDCNLIRVLKRCQMHGIVWSWRPPGPRAIFERAAVWDSLISWRMLSLLLPRVWNWSRKTRIGVKRLRGPRSCCLLNRHIRRTGRYPQVCLSFLIQPAINGSEHIFGPLLKV